VAVLIESGDVEFQSGWVSEKKRKEIQDACRRLGTSALRPIKNAVSADTTYDDIRLVVAQFRREEKQQEQATGS
jgi:uncharacterized protein YpbB